MCEERISVCCLIDNPCLGHFKGSIFVTEAAEKHLKSSSLLKNFISVFVDNLIILHQAFLKGSKFHNDIPSMKQYFDKTTKCSFRASEPNDPHYIRFGSARDKDMKYKITAGKLRLEGFVLHTTFQPSGPNDFNVGQLLLHFSSLPLSASSMAF